MRIHSDILTADDLRTAAQVAGDDVRISVAEHGSRKRARAFAFSLSGTSSRDRQWASDTLPVKAATWDEWGMVIAELFRRDPDATIAQAYPSAEFFHWTTGGRFRSLTPADQHGGAGHKWRPMGHNATGAYVVAECRGTRHYACTAILRRMAAGHTFAEISEA